MKSPPQFILENYGRTKMWFSKYLIFPKSTNKRMYKINKNIFLIFVARRWLILAPTHLHSQWRIRGYIVLYEKLFDLIFFYNFESFYVCFRKIELFGNRCHVTRAVGQTLNITQRKHFFILFSYIFFIFSEEKKNFENWC